MSEFIHPEVRDKEIFFTNGTTEQFETFTLISKRLGNKSYDGEGNHLSSQNWFPFFISKDDQALFGKTITELRMEWRKMVETSK